MIAAASKRHIPVATIVLPLVVFTFRAISKTRDVSTHKSFSLDVQPRITHSFVNYSMPDSPLWSLGSGLSRPGLET